MDKTTAPKDPIGARGRLLLNFGFCDIMLHLWPILVALVRTSYVTSVIRKDTTKPSAGRSRNGRTRRMLLRRTLQTISMSGDSVSTFRGCIPISLASSLRGCVGNTSLKHGNYLLFHILFHRHYSYTSDSLVAIVTYLIFLTYKS